MAPLNFDLDAILPRSLHLTSPSTTSSSTLFTRTDTAISPIESRDLATSKTSLFRRDDDDNTPPVPIGDGTMDPSSINNQGFIALFAILGAAMVIASIWFFFWAKNGGFHFREGDWEDYKSTVLRRKGPDGKTLSNATKSTRLGGGTSIAGTQNYRWAKQAARSVVSRDEKGRKGIIAKRGWANTHSVTYSDDYMTESFGTATVSDEMSEVRTNADDLEAGHHAQRYRDRDVREYKRERPARVGGMNRLADGSSYLEGSAPSHSDLASDVSSSHPILGAPPTVSAPSVKRDRETARAERRAREEAAKMERRWKKEAEEAAAALAAENSRGKKHAAAAAAPASTRHSTKVPTSSSPAKPSSAKRRSDSPSKPRASHRDSRDHRDRHHHQPKSSRDFSYSGASEVLSTAYTPTERSGTSGTGTRAGSYYDSYRPAAARGGESVAGYSAQYGRARRESEAGGKKGRVGGGGGYRRGQDSDFE